MKEKLLAEIRKLGIEEFETMQMLNLLDGSVLYDFDGQRR